MHQFKPVSYEEIFIRWHQAVIANNLMKWHAISCWLKSEALLCKIDHCQEAADSMQTLSDVAHQRALDLQPQHELEAA